MTMPPSGNVLLIVVDQLRGDALGCVGHPVVRTPNIDALAARGVTFRRHFAQSSPCGPSRASMLSGQYLMSHRVVTNDTPTAAHLKTLPDFARASGYEPALIGYTTTVPDPRSTHPNDPRLTTNTIATGWDVVRDFEGERTHYLAYLTGLGYDVPRRYVDLFVPPRGWDERERFAASPIRAEHSETAWSADGALEYIRLRRDRPWMLHLGFYRPHPPFMAPAPYDTLYDPTTVPLPARAASPVAEGRVHPLTRLLLDTVKAKTAIHHREGLARDLDLADVRRMRAAYYGLITEVDDHLGRIFSLLAETGQAERTLVILTSDHGEQLGDNHLVSKRGYFPKSYHIPCIVSDPRGPADATRGRHVDAFSENVDVLPTILDWIGHPPARQCDGRSLLGWTRAGSPERWRRYVHWEYDFRDQAGNRAHEHLGIARDQCNLAVIADDEHAYLHFAALPPLMFDLKRDPCWLTNVADDPAYQAVALRYARAMLDWRLAHADRTLTGYAIGAQGIEART